MVRTDIHQHLWPEAFIGALARRPRPPLARRSGSEWVLRLEGEPEHRFELSDHDPDARAAALGREGIHRALIAASSPLGVEALPPDEAEPLLDSYHEGVLELGPSFAAWGSIAVRSPDPGAVDDLLRRGFVGVSLPAGALATREGLERCGPVLSRLAAHRAPLFVHPGPGSRDAQPEDGDRAGAPAWWAAMTSYVADMNAAWHAFAAWGRRAHPQLRVAFAMLAGGAPLHHERSVARGGPTEAIADPLFFYDTSSYGERAIDAVVRVVGIDQLVYGSDRPVVDPPPPSLLGPAATEAILTSNPTRLLHAPDRQAVAA